MINRPLAAVRLLGFAVWPAGGRVMDGSLIFLRGASDPEWLDWAAKEGRVIVTPDVNTMTKFARCGEPFAALFLRLEVRAEYTVPVSEEPGYEHQA